jgi:hypothetical protein
MPIIRKDETAPGNGSFTFVRQDFFPTAAAGFGEAWQEVPEIQGKSLEIAP